MSRCKRHGITRLEVVVITAIVLMLLGLLLPMTSRSVDGDYRTECANNLRCIIQSQLNYRDNDGRPRPQAKDKPEKFFPTGCLGTGSPPEERLSWLVTILPYMEQSQLYEQFNLKNGYASNRVPANTRIKHYQCPSAARSPDNITHYIALAGISRNAAGRSAGEIGNGFMGYERLTSAEMVEDGLSHTIALIESRKDNGPWAQGGASNLRGLEPNDTPLFGDNGQFGGHSHSCNAMMADGSMQRIAYSLDAKKLAAAITIAGKDAFELD